MQGTQNAFCDKCTVGDPRNPQRLSWATWKRHNRKRPRLQQATANAGGGGAAAATNAPVHEAPTLGGTPLNAEVGPRDADVGQRENPAAGSETTNRSSSSHPDESWESTTVSDDTSYHDSCASSKGSSGNGGALKEGSLARDAPPQPIIQENLTTKEVLLPVIQFTENVNDLAIFAVRVQSGMSHEAVKGFLRLGVCTAKYRTPRLMEGLVNARVHVQARLVDACSNGCVAFTFSRAQCTSCDYCGEQGFR